MTVIDSRLQPNPTTTKLKHRNSYSTKSFDIFNFIFIFLYFSRFFREGKFEIPPLIWYDRERDEREHNGDTGVCTRRLIRASSMMIKSSRKKQKKNAQLRQTEETNEKNRETCDRIKIWNAEKNVVYSIYILYVCLSSSLLIYPMFYKYVTHSSVLFFRISLFNICVLALFPKKPIAHIRFDFLFAIA